MNRISEDKLYLTEIKQEQYMNPLLHKSSQQNQQFSSSFQNQHEFMKTDVCVGDTINLGIRGFNY